MATQAELQAAIDQLQLNIARIQSFTNDLTGTLNVAIDGGTIPSLMKIVNTILNTVPVKGYVTQVELLADLVPGDKTIAYAGDTENEFVKSGATGVGSWVPSGNSKLAQAFSFGRNAARYADDLYRFSALPKPFLWEDSAAGALVYTIGLTVPATRFTMTADATGLQGVGLSGIGATARPVGNKVTYDALPGDQYAIEFSFTGGTPDANCGFWFGTDNNNVASMSTATRMICYRNHVLLPCLDNGITTDSGRTTVPTWIGGGTPLTVGTKYLLTLSIQNDRSVLARVFKDGIQQFVDVVISSPGPTGYVVFGMNLINGVTGKMTVVTKAVYPGNLVYVDSSVAASGTGTLGSPVKYFYEVENVVRNLRLYGKPVTIQLLDDTNYGGIKVDNKSAIKWDIIGKPGGRTVIDGSQPSEAITWTLLAGATKTYTTPLKLNNILLSVGNEVFIIGQATTALNSTWVTFPDTTVPQTSTPVKTNMDLLTGGGCESAGGLLYLRLPDGTPGGFNPASSTLVVSRTNQIIEVVGTPEVNLTNLTLRHAAQHCFTGGAGHGVIRGVNAEWSGYSGNGFEEYNSAFEFHACKAKYIGNDCFGRTPRTDMPYQPGNRFISRFYGCEMSHTIQGDGTSQHVVDFPVTATSSSSELWMYNCNIHDCNKCGVVTSTDICVISGGHITRCGQEQLSLFCPPTTIAIGKTMRMYVSGVTIDPEGLGLNSVRSIAYAGVTLVLMELLGCHIGQPSAAGGASEWNVTTNPLSGQTIDPAKNVVRFRQCTTTRAPGSVVKVGNGTGGTIDPAPAYAAA